MTNIQIAQAEYDAARNLCEVLVKLVFSIGRVCPESKAAKEAFRAAELLKIEAGNRLNHALDLQEGISL